MREPGESNGRSLIDDTGPSDVPDPSDTGAAPDGRAGPAGQPRTADERTELRVQLGGGALYTLRFRPDLLLVRTGFALISLHLVLTAIRLGRSWWWQDDLYIFGLVADRGLTPGLVFGDYNGHLEPGTWLMAWLSTHLAPFAWWPAALVQLGFAAAIDLTLFALLRRMFGTRPAVLVPLAMFCATSLTVNATLWWSAAMQWLPTTLCLALCLYFHVGFLTTGDRRQALGAIWSLVGGLLFFEKALTVLAVLAFVTLAYDTSGPWLRRPARAFDRHRAYWGSMTLLAVGYLVLYFSRTTVTSLPAKSGGQVLELVRESVLYTYLPGMFGGPLSWGAMPASVVTWPTPSTLLIWVGALLAAAFVLGSLWAGRAGRGFADRSLGAPGAAAAWVLLASFLGLTIVLLARTRLGALGPMIGRDHRYLTDAALLGPLCLALAWLPLRSMGAAQRTDPPGPPPRHAGALLAAGTVFVLAVTTGGVISGERYMRAWTRNPGADYVTNLREDLAANGPVAMFDQSVPTAMMMATFGDGARLSRVTGPLPERPRFVTWAPAVKVVDDEGHLRDAHVRGLTAPGRPTVCGSGQVARRLPSAALRWSWKVEIVYTARRDTSAMVSLDDGRGGARAVPVQLSAGMHRLYVAVVGGGNRVMLFRLEPGAVVCLGQVSVGQLRPERPAGPGA